MVATVMMGNTVVVSLFIMLSTVTPTITKTMLEIKAARKAVITVMVGPIRLPPLVVPMTLVTSTVVTFLVVKLMNGEAAATRTMVVETRLTMSVRLTPG